ncbi:MAG: DNA polymerase III subunit alpha [Spirochaetales bacterium]|nr:DNA polymerase III subunit alpha [Spirochaetales bacterium]
MNGITSQFIHLHVHSEYSLYDSTIHLHRYVEEARHRGLKHLAVTDSGNLFAAAEFYRLCQDAGINPIIGCQFNMDSSSLSTGKTQEGTTLILIAETTQGYHNLMQLSTHYYLDNDEPLLTDSLLERFHEGIIALSGELGREEDAERRLKELEGIFGEDNLFLEIHNHGSENERQVNCALQKLAKKTGIRLVTTNAVHYLHKEEVEAYQVLRKIGSIHNKKVEINTEDPSEQYYLKTHEQMNSLFSDIPVAIENTVRIAERCSIELPLNAPDLPAPSIPSEYASSNEYLKAFVMEGLSHRYNPVPVQAYKRAEKELEAVGNVGYFDYFLIIADYVAFAHKSDIPVEPGRGSAAGSIIAYALGITDVDPLKYGLLSERFLNPERIATPDIDIDFCFERRGEVIDYVRKTYGDEHTANIITFGRYKARSAVRDVGRAMGLSFSEIESLTKSIPTRPGMSIKAALEEIQELQDAVAENTVTGKVLNIAQVLEELPRNVATHAAGIVLSREAITSYSPLYKEKDVCTQYTSDQLAELGPVKFNFLGFKVLTLLHNCENRIREKNPEFSLSQIPDDDELAFRLLGEGNTTGVFQCESSGMKAILKEARPQSIEELAALNALYRPGAMEMIPQYIEAKQTEIREHYLPKLEDILAPTYGIILYQEQIMEIAQAVAGWSYGKADILRQTLSKSDVKGEQVLKSSFIDDVTRNGYTEEKAEEIFELIFRTVKFSALKAHTISYSLLAYRSAFLKAHYPEEYMSSLLEIEKDNPDRYEWYLSEAKKIGV